MKNNNEKGFTLILSLLLLMVMSLMGGALIVITSGDHQSNNTSDQYQQAFYVAETALIEGEKAIINKMMGPWEDGVRNTENADLPLNRENDDDGQPILNKGSDCFRSFRNIDRANFLATNHIENQHFYQLIKGILDVDSNIIDTLEGTTDKTRKIDAEILQILITSNFKYDPTKTSLTKTALETLVIIISINKFNYLLAFVFKIFLCRAFFS